MRRYPRSFLQLITLGYLFVAIPLITLTGYAVFTVDSIGNHYRMVVGNIAETSHLIADLTEDMVHMERNLRRYQVLQDQEALEEFEHVRSEWRIHLQKFGANRFLPDDLRKELETQRVREESVHDQWRQDGLIVPMRTEIDSLRERTDALRDSIQALIVSDQRSIAENAEIFYQHLLAATVFAVSLAIAMLWLTRRLVSRLLARFEKAVLALGRGDLDTPIQLSGPSDLRWLGRWLEWLRRRLKSLEEGRVLSLRHVSHELKTPLAAMQEGSALLSEEVAGPLTANQARVVKVIASNSKRLQELIEGLLSLQMAAHASERIGYRTLAADEIVRQVLETQRLLAQEHGVTIQEVIEPVTVIAGAEAVQTIAHNLLSNAIKYSPPGGQVDITLVSEGEHLVLRVSDQGPGIPAGDREHLFEPFFRGQQTRHLPGVGLGLAITRQFVQAHRGQIEVEEGANGGACFVVRIPLTADFLRKQQNV